MPFCWGNSNRLTYFSISLTSDLTTGTLTTTAMTTLPTPAITQQTPAVTTNANTIKTLEEIVHKLNRKARYLKKAHDDSRQELAGALAKVATLECKLAELEAKAAQTCEATDERITNVHATVKSVKDMTEKTARGRDLALDRVESSLWTRIDVIKANVDAQALAIERIETQLQRQTSVTQTRYRDLTIEMKLLAGDVRSTTAKQEQMSASLIREVLFFIDRANADHQKHQDMVMQLECQRPDQS